MTDIFLSYAREDQARIAPLAAALTDAGFDVWWDKRLAGGAEFSRETEEQLNKARVILVAWSKAASESMWVADEATVGREKGNLIPIVLDGSEPRIGFRQIQTTDFSSWRGGPTEEPLTGLIDTLRVRLDAPPQPAQPPPSPDSRQRLLIAGTLSVAAIALAAIVAMNNRGGAGETQPANQVAEAPAIDDPSLSVLEALAADLEKNGDLRGASAAYTRYAARALAADRARGLAARRKAFDLDPQSIIALQGLLYDTALNRGGLQALELGDAILARADLTPRVRSFALTILGTLDLDIVGDLNAAQTRLDLLRKLSAENEDSTILYAALSLDSALDLRLGRYQAGLEKAEQAEKLYPSMPPDVPRNGEILVALTKYASGDWHGALEAGTKAIERRRRVGEFLAVPMLDATCRAALFLDRPKDDAGACGLVSGRGARDGNAFGKIFAALQAAHEGDFTAARGDLEAAAAMAPPAGLPSAAQSLGFRAQLFEAEAYIAVRSGDFEAARRLVSEAMTPQSNNPIIRQFEQRLRAAAARFLAQAMLRSGASDAACAEAARAAEFHRQMNAAPGVAAVEALARDAGC